MFTKAGSALYTRLIIHFNIMPFLLHFMQSMYL